MLRRVLKAWAKFCGLCVRAVLRVNGITCGKSLRVRGVPVVIARRGSSITIGERVTFASSELSNALGVSHRCIVRTLSPQATISIGRDVGVTGSTILARTAISIGDRVLIGANCTIVDSDLHPLDHRARAANDESAIRVSPVVIGNDVWLGMSVIVLKGVSIGDRTVIGAGSVVVNSLPADSVAAGNPARVIRRLTQDDHSRPDSSR